VHSGSSGGKCEESVLHKQHALKWGKSGLSLVYEKNNKGTR
jgi:hypothetical protein